MVVFLHGFCLPDENQQRYNFTAVRAGAGVGGTPRRQTLTQVGLRDFVDEAFYVTPVSPTTTRLCALVQPGRGLAERRGPPHDELDQQHADARRARVFVPDVGRLGRLLRAGEGRKRDRRRFPREDGHWRSSPAGEHAAFVDPNRVYLVGIATGGFMANRFACERPDLVAGVVTFAGGVWNDAAKCAGSPATTNGVLSIHGDADKTVPIEGGVNFAGVRFPSAERVEILADAFACDAETSERRSRFP